MYRAVHNTKGRPPKDDECVYCLLKKQTSDSCWCTGDSGIVTRKCKETLFHVPSATRIEGSTVLPHFLTFGNVMTGGIHISVSEFGLNQAWDVAEFWRVEHIYTLLHGTHFFVIKPTRCTNFTNLFCHETLHVSDSSSVHHQEFIHCTLSNGICHTCL